MTFVNGARTTIRSTIVVLVLLLSVAVMLQSYGVRREISGMESRTPVGDVDEIVPSFPADVLIDDFDKTIQHRFLTAPSFGMARLAPKVPPGPKNPHFESFHPSGESEYSAIRAFAMNGWDVGIYLYGRRVTRRTDTKKEKYNIAYRQFDPIPVTGGLKRSDFPHSKDLVPDIKDAFVTFTEKNGAIENEIRLGKGRWSYVMRPVRASSQSCLQCHKDPVLTARLGGGRFTVRERRIGDPNGVLVYAFRRTSE